MWFKKSSLKKSSLIPKIIWTIILFIVFLFWFILIKNIQVFNYKIDKNDNLLNNSEKVEIKEKNIKKVEKIEEKIEEKKINILLIWRWGGNHDAPDLTDTIILASINTKTKTLSMFSIPRDLYIKYPNNRNWKINSLYASYLYRSGSKKEWIDALKNKVTEMTWENIDYYINVDFNWFKKIIDTIWWIEITVLENFVDYKYPDSNWWYKTLVFKKWTWIFDWDNALKYSRSRYSTSDFDRSIRQQQVIKAIKDKLTWSYFLTSPLKIKKLYEVFVNHVDTDLSLTMIAKLAYSLNWKNDINVLSSNLTYMCGFWNICEKWWFLYAPDRSLFWWISVLLLEWTTINTLSKYDDLKKYTNIIFNYPWVYTENYKINIFNWVKVSNVAWKLSNDIVKYWFNVPDKNSIWNADKIYEKSIIYYNNIDENSQTIQALKTLFDWEFKKTETTMFTTDNANIEIIIWEDYKLKESPFKF